MIDFDVELVKLVADFIKIVNQDGYLKISLYDYKLIFGNEIN